MSGKTITRYQLQCDGCRITIGQSGEYENGVEARAAAYAKGWRFPCRTKLNGGKSSRTVDVCPECLPTFDPTTVTARGGSA